MPGLVLIEVVVAGVAEAGPGNPKARNRGVRRERPVSVKLRKARARVKAVWSFKSSNERVRSRVCKREVEGEDVQEGDRLRGRRWRARARVRGRAGSGPSRLRRGRAQARGWRSASESGSRWSACGGRAQEGHISRLAIESTGWVGAGRIGGCKFRRWEWVWDGIGGVWVGGGGCGDRWVRVCGARGRAARSGGAKGVWDSREQEGEEPGRRESLSERNSGLRDGQGETGWRERGLGDEERTGRGLGWRVL